jgi:exonuclease VII large subunit
VKRLLYGKAEQLAQLRMMADKQTRNLLSRKKDQLLLLETRTQLVDPANILRRGYSITMMNGKAIKDIDEVDQGSELETRLHNGRLISRATRILPEDQAPGGKTNPADEP